MTQDTEQPRTRLDFDESNPCTPGLKLNAERWSHSHATYEVQLGCADPYGQDKPDARRLQREIEDALIARALRVATREELLEAGAVRFDLSDQPPDMVIMVWRRICEALDPAVRVAFAIEGVSDEVLAEAGLVRVSDGPESKRHGMYKTALLGIDVKSTTLEDAKMRAAKALYGDLPRQRAERESGGAS